MAMYEPLLKHYVLRFRFMQEYCAYQNNWCNGKHIPEIDKKGNDISRTPDKAPCPHYKNKRCQHCKHNFLSKGELK